MRPYQPDDPLSNGTAFIHHIRLDHVHLSLKNHLYDYLFEEEQDYSNQGKCSMTSPVYNFIEKSAKNDSNFTHQLADSFTRQIGPRTK